MKNGKLIPKLLLQLQCSILADCSEKGSSVKSAKYVFLRPACYSNIKKLVLGAQTRGLLMSVICLASCNCISNAA